MKNQLLKTKWLEFFLITAFVIFPLNLAWGEQNFRQGEAFSQGVTPVVLTPEERAELSLYAENSINFLREALKKAKDKSSEEANQIYERSIKRVVQTSFERKGQSELLMRFILNQALEVTIGSREKDATQGIGFNGVLKNSGNAALVASIYNNSIKLALDYADDDQRAVNSSSLSKLPYIEMAHRRLLLTQEWSKGTFGTNLKYQFLQVVLTHWHTTVAQRGNLSRKSVSNLILNVGDKLDEVKRVSSIGEKYRILLGQMNDLLKKLFKVTGIKLKKNQEEEGEWYWCDDDLDNCEEEEEEDEYWYDDECNYC